MGVIGVAEVKLQEGESIESALRRFKRKVMTEDIIKEIKRHSYYLKPGAKRRVKQARRFPMSPPPKDKGRPFNGAAPCGELSLRLRQGHAKSR